MRETDKAHDNKQEISLQFGSHFLTLAKEKLSSRELLLIRLLQEQLPQTKSRETPWQKFLNGHSWQQPTSKEHLRFLYFRIENLSLDRKNEWQKLILSFFKKDTSSFWNDDQSLLIIDEDCIMSKEELTGIVSSVDNDFDTKTNFLMGLVWSKTDDLPAVFAEEKIINSTFSKIRPYETVTSAALKFYLHYQRPSVILKSYRKKLEAVEYLPHLITTLYKNEGNISQAAKEMYIHRNTLEYRIDKLQSEDCLNLRQMDDLIFCYLAIV